jgi:hypothetical protein
MARKKLMVCGCSFSAITVEEKYWGTHFSEILSKRLDWDLVNLAYAGCSNGGIRLQIEEVVRQKPDFAIIIPTFFDRTEIPIHTLKLDWSKVVWNILDNITRTPTAYDAERGVENINHKNSTNPALICENYNSIVHNWDHPYRKKQAISDEAVHAVRDYVSYLYDPGWKKQQDQWMIEHGCLELVKNNIPFIMIPTMSLWQGDSKLRLLDEKYYTTDADHCPCVTHTKPEYSFGKFDTENEKDPGYHTNADGQIYLANKYQELMRERWGIYD